MKSVVMLFISFLILMSVGVPKRLAVISQILRNHCYQSLPDSKFKELNAALVCGTTLESTETKGLFQVTGLIHLIVVSGSHLIFLQQIIAYILSRFLRTAPPFRLICCALLLFTLMTGLQAPCARAFIQMCLSYVNKKHKLFWRPWQLTLLSGFVCLALFPEWVKSPSLLMSWVCALSLSLPIKTNNKLQEHAVVYIVLLPLLSSLALPHPAVILINFAFTPLFATVLFPIALLSAPLHLLTPVADILWGLLVLSLEHISPYVSPLGTYNVTTISQWLFLLIIHIGTQFYFIRKAQRA